MKKQATTQPITTQISSTPDNTQVESAIGHSWPPVWPAFDKARFPDGLVPYA
ncbi:hypothetical protein HYX70_05135 [Candidatus Saccharibacteria bacterium]|nr:hypothetical protein [Candidatus Saccharibacteria bacterium]